MAFKENLQALKDLLKANLTAENTELITKIDKGLDTLSGDHSATEEKLSQTQDKLIEIVKGTSFKVEGEPDPIEDNTKKVPTIDEALEIAFKDIESKRSK